MPVCSPCHRQVHALFTNRTLAGQLDTLEKLRAEAAAIDKKQREIERKHRGEREKLTNELDEAREKFRSAMEEWAR